MMDSNWARWIKSSSIVFFKGIMDAAGLPMFIEGTDRRTANEKSFCEFRFDGPSGELCNPNYWRLPFTINILVVTKRTNEDVYGHDRNVGLVCSAFPTDLAIMKFGDGANDDQTQLGCAKLIPGAAGRIDVANFGQIDPVLLELQSSVEANYVLELILRG